MDFHEFQRMDVKWLRWLFMFIGAAVAIGVSYAVISGSEEADGMGLYIGVIITIGTMILAYWMVFNSELETIISHAGFQYRYAPFITKAQTLAWHDIESWEIITLTDNMGFVGYNYGYKKQRFKKLVTCILGGDTAVRFVLDNGYTFVFNTRTPIELQQALSKYMAHKRKT